MKPSGHHVFCRRFLPSLARVVLLTGAVLWSSTLLQAREEVADAPLLRQLGSHHHPITTGNPRAQRYFDQGVLLLYAFNHDEAIRSFRAAARLDPAAAMPHWGIAFALGPNINRPMDPSAAAPAWEALQAARERAAQASPREQAYIRALAARYEAGPVADRSALDLAFADAMREVMRAHPDDPDAATLFCEAVMDTMPWDYWQSDRRPKPATHEVIATLRNVLRRDPDHPGANHFYIHILEAGPTPEDALVAADRLRALQLGAAHLVHMPSHIYVRTGRYAEAIDVNEEAVRMDRNYIRECKAQGFYPAVYYPHNLHFVWFANLMAGVGRDAVRTAERMVDLEQDTRCGPNALLEAVRFRHLPVLTLARFGQWDRVRSERRPDEASPFDLAMWHYAQGLADAAQQRGDAAASHLAQLKGLAATDALQQLNAPTFPASAVLQVATWVLEGKVALAQGQGERAIDALRKAVQAEDEIPYMEPPFWPVPTRQTLGAVLLITERAVDAESVFRADLERNPRNGWSLMGLRESLRNQQRTDAAERVDREFALAWERADAQPQLAWY